MSWFGCDRPKRTFHIGAYRDMRHESCRVCMPRPMPGDPPQGGSALSRPTHDARYRTVAYYWETVQLPPHLEWRCLDCGAITRTRVACDSLWDTPISIEG